jgi:hypothetical protein
MTDQTQDTGAEPRQETTPERRPDDGPTDQ